MNWDAIGAIGEVGGTVAVVATLFLLYRQIKQSSEITKAQIDTMAKDQLAQLTIHAVVTPDLARIIEAGHSPDPSELTDDEIRRMFWWLTTYGTILEGMFIRWRLDQLDDEMWVGYEKIMLGALAAPVGREWWDAEMTPFSRAFRAHFDARLASPDADRSWNVARPNVVKG